MTSDDVVVRQWVHNPAFDVRGNELVNDAEGTRLTLTPPLRQMWDTDAPSQVRLTKDAERELRRLRVIVPPRASAAAASGLASSAADSPTLPLGRWATAPPWGLIGAAVDMGGPPGTRPRDAVPIVRELLARRFRGLAAPNAWSWQLRARPRDGFAGVIDHGDLLLDPQTDTGVDVHKRLAAIVSVIVGQGHRPLVLGGDHSLTYPVIRSMITQHPGLRVVHFDAHADRRPKGNAATADCGNFVSWSLAGHPDLRWMTIGVRGVDGQVDLSDSAQDDRVAYLTAEEVRTDLPFDAIDRFCDGRPVYLTVDIDVLDPLYAPDVVYSSLGGLNPATLGALVCRVLAVGRVVGADFVEACPSRAGPHMTAARLADLCTMIQLVEAGMSGRDPGVAGAAEPSASSVEEDVT